MNLCGFQKILSNSKDPSAIIRLKNQYKFIMDNYLVRSKKRKDCTVEMKTK